MTDGKQVLKLNIRPTPDQSWTLADIFKKKAFPSSWRRVFEESEYDLIELSEILEDEEKKYGYWYPLKQDLFSAFEHTSLNDVRVVIIGQDPYPQSLDSGLPRATGMSFSVRKDDVIPSSLKNIYLELKNTVKEFEIPDHGDLTEWAKQGVLLLNSCLTVRPSQPESHKKIWMGFVYKGVKAIGEVRPKTIYLLWGAKAQEMAKIIDQPAIILISAHPSGFSANRGFFGCDHFNKVNGYLKDDPKGPINWQITPIGGKYMKKI